MKLTLEQQFQESLAASLQDADEDKDQYLGMLPLQWWVSVVALTGTGISLREFIHEFKHQTLVLFKCCLLQPKVTVLRSGVTYISHPYLDAFLWVSM